MSENHSPAVANESAASEGLRLRRAGSLLTGVCSGIAEYFHVDVTLVRAGAVLLAFTTGVGTLAYITAAYVMAPDERADEPVTSKPWFDGYAFVQQSKRSLRAMLEATLDHDKKAFQRHWDDQVDSFRRACQ